VVATATAYGTAATSHPVVVKQAVAYRACDASTASPQILHPACASARPDVVVGG